MEIKSFGVISDSHETVDSIMSSVDHLSSKATLILFVGLLIFTSKYKRGRTKKKQNKKKRYLFMKHVLFQILQVRREKKIF